jgi:hypothetical protein
MEQVNNKQDKEIFVHVYCEMKIVIGILLICCEMYEFGMISCVLVHIQHGCRLTLCFTEQQEMLCRICHVLKQIQLHHNISATGDLDRKMVHSFQGFLFF